MADVSPRVDETVPPTRALTVSVVIPVRDGQRYVSEAINSVLKQTRPVDEVIVVDDGSTDESAGIAEKFGGPVRVIRTDPLGTAAARNTGIAACSGDLIALCDADDLFEINKIAEQLRWIDDAEAPLAVFCGMSEFVSPELDPSMIPGRAPREMVERARSASTLLATREAFVRAGPFDTALTHSEWVPWCVKLGSAARIEFAEGVLVRRRLHDRNLSLGVEGDIGAWAEALHAHLRRNSQG